MNNELLAQLLPIIEKSKEGILKGIEFAQEQVPVLVQQILAWEFWHNLILTLGGVLCFIIIGWGLTFCLSLHKKKKQENKYYESVDIWAPFTILATSFFILGVALFCSIFKVVKILVAPNLFLLEYISKFINL